MASKTCSLILILLIIILSTLSLAMSRSLGPVNRSLLQSQSPAPSPLSQSQSDQHGPNATAAPPVPERQSLTDLITALKKSPKCMSSTAPNCPKGRLVLPELQGQGIIVGNSAIVSKDGSGDFTTIGDAIKIVPANLKPEDGYFVIYAKSGYYEEYINIPRHKRNILLLGDGINQTIITGNHSNANGWGTSNSATFAVAGYRFIAIDATFQNTYGPGSQAVALRNNADLSAFYRCSFDGYQDTLYVHSGTQFYRDCDVYGTIDFIFGDAAAVFQNCRIFGRIPRGCGAVVFTASGRQEADENTAIVFHNCTVDAAPDLAAEPVEERRGSAWLGRPWRPYARVVYMQSYIGDLVDQRGWMEMNGDGDDLDTLYYGEYRNYGPGASTDHRVNWPGVRSAMTDTEAAMFTVQNLTNGGSWLPDTGIPFSLGLL